MSEVKVNKISPRTACGTTTLGDSGDTFTLPSGGTMTVASGATITNLGTATGFGGTGVVSWNTTKITADPSPAVTGTGYFCDTTSGGFTVTLPASPSAGDVIGISDYAKTFDTNNLTLGRNSEPIGGIAVDATLATEGIAVTLVYVDATKGWIVTDSGLQSNVATAAYMAASGGNTTLTCGDYKTHVFTGPGTFCVSAAGNACGSNTIDYFVVAGGGSAAGYYGAAGAGGFRMSSSLGLAACATSPLAVCAGLPVAVAGYPVAVGAGGTAGPAAPGVGAYAGNNGTPSVFTGTSTITSAGGGYGNASPAPNPGGPGGSGGASGYTGGCAGRGTGNIPCVSPPQGNPGGRRSYGAGGAGGGAGAAGGDGTCGCSVTCSPAGGPQKGGDGGQGSYISDAAFGPTAPSYGTPGPVGSTRYFAGGGAGGVCSSGPPTVGASSSGNGGTAVKNSAPGSFGPAQNASVNTGGGGNASAGGLGGSGIVVIRYKFQ